MPDPVSAVVGVGAGSALIGSGGQAYAAHESADAQKKAAKEAADVQWDMYMQSREDLAPWREAGARAVGTLEGMIGAGPGEFKESPSYQFALSEGLKGQQRAASATGRLGSGAYLKGATRYAEDLASTEYDNFLRRWYQSLTPWQSMAGLGQTAGAQTGANALATGRGMGASYLYGGEAKAGEYMNYGNIGADFMSGLSQNYLYDYYRNQAGNAGYSTGPYGIGNMPVGAPEYESKYYGY